MKTIPACIRTGMCCELIYLTISPRKLKQYLEENVGEDMDIIAPMLEGRCIGKIEIPNGFSLAKFAYLYGPCANLGYEEKSNIRLAKCLIQEHKPRMCSNYPHYGKDPHEWNLGMYRGCGYNNDPSIGNTKEELTSKLLPLDEEDL